MIPKIVVTVLGSLVAILYAQSEPISPTSDAPVAVACTVECGQGHCGEGRHVAITGPTDEEDGGPHGTCADQPCCFLGSSPCKHPCCDCDVGGRDEDLEELVLAVDAGEWTRIRELIADWPEISINTDRSSIQVFSSCRDERVIANIPVPGMSLAYLLHGRSAAAMAQD